MSNSITYLGKTYTDAEIISGSFSKSESLNMAELPVDTVELTIRPIANLGFRTSENYPFITADGYEFETTEGNPLSTSFQQNTPVVQYRDGSQTAIWYLQSINRIGADVYKLNGISSLGRLTQRTHYGGIYNGVQAQTIIAEIMGDMPYYVDDVFKTVLVYGWLPIATARDNLQQLLFALNANLTTDANGTLRIENLSTAITTAITESEIYQSDAKVKYNNPITSVVVLAHQFIEQNTDTITLFDGTATDGQVVTFSEPVSNLSATGFTITSSGANYAVLSAGTGMLIGCPYVHTTREYTRSVTAADIPNVVRVENATLVDQYSASDVVNRLQAYYSCRQTINVSAADTIADVGDVIQVYDPFDKIMRQACVGKNNVSLSNTQKSTLSAVIGFAPWQVVESVNVHELIATSQTYTFPADLANNTEITAVLIGGGQGGANGANGSNGTGGMNEYTGGQVHFTVDAGVGGAGGIGGVGGSGGNVIIVRFTVDPSDTITVNIGAGGASNGGVGGNTTITFDGTQYTSADGSATQYFDPESNITYGIGGQDGASGSAGGKGFTYNASEYGESGEDCGQYIGGSGCKRNAIANPSVYARGYLMRGGAGGGGAAIGGNGKNATDIIGSESPSFLTGGSGGNGGNGANGVAPTNYGDGGNGGNGGGGGGGTGETEFWGVGSSFVGTVSAYAGGTGGTGGAGSAGKNGCVILIYRKPAS